MATIRRPKRLTPFVQIDKRPLQNAALSWRARGLLAYLLSLPDNWTIRKTELQKHATDGRDATNAAFKELQKHGHIIQTTERDKNGRFLYTFEVVENLPLTEKPLTGGPLTVPPSLIIINKEEEEKTNFSKPVSGDLPTDTPQAPDKRQNKSLPFDVVTAAHTLAEYDAAEIKTAVKQIYGLTITNQQIKTAAHSFATVAVATYDKYRGIRQAEKLKNLFIAWIPKNLKYNQRTKTESAAQVGDLKKFYKNKFSKDWHLRNELRIKQDCKNFAEWLPRIIELKKELKNKTLDEIKIFYIIFRNLGETISPSPNPKTRLNAFLKWFYKLSDYKQKFGDIESILKAKAEKENY